MRLKFDAKTKDLIVWNGRVVMSRSEARFFEMLFRRLAHMKPQKVLEVGFGLGISARLIQRHLRPKVHDIVEIDEGIGEDLRRYAAQRSGVCGIFGDFWDFRHHRRYDFIFFDPFDYYSSEDAYYVTEKESQCYDQDKARRLAMLLAVQGVVCCPHFGSGGFEPMPGFRIVHRERLRIPPLLLDSGRRTTHAAIVCWQPADDYHVWDSPGR